MASKPIVKRYEGNPILMRARPSMGAATSCYFAPTCVTDDPSSALHGAMTVISSKWGPSRS